MESLPRAYASTSALYYRGQPSLDDILGSTQEYADRLQEVAARLHTGLLDTGLAHFNGTLPIQKASPPPHLARNILPPNS